MEKRILLFVFLSLNIGLANAQWNNNAIWSYDFGNVVGAFVNTPGTTNSLSTASVAGFLPVPPSGNTGVYINASATDGSFTLNGDNSLTAKMPSASTIRYSAYQIPPATDVVMHSFTIKFSPAINVKDVGSYTYAIGHNNGNLFTSTSNSSVYRSSAELFAVLRWIPVTTANSTAITVAYRNGSDASANTLYTDIDATTFVKGSSYDVEVYCNNSTSVKQYTRGITSYDLPQNIFHIWVNGAQLGGDYPRSKEVSGVDATLTTNPSIAMANGVLLDSYLFTVTGAPTATGYITLSSPTLNYLTAVTPVTLTSFSGNVSGKTNQLNWQTVSELNNAYFEILRSQNGTDFNVLTKVMGAGTMSGRKKYTYIDDNPNPGVNYYQLKQIDLSGTPTIYDETLALINYLNSDGLKVTFADDMLFAKIYSAKSGKAEMDIFDLYGKKVLTTTVLLREGYNTYQDFVPFIRSGIYVAVLNNPGNVQRAKCIK